MNRPFPELQYPRPDWAELDPRAEGGVERLLATVANRGGSVATAYAEALRPELVTIVAEARGRDAAPLLVLIPPVPLHARPLVAATAYVAAILCPAEERSPAAVADAFRAERAFVVGRPAISLTELPAGPACRVHEMAVGSRGMSGLGGRGELMEYVSYFVAAPEWTDGLVEMTVTWAGPAAGPDLSAFADDLAATLRLTGAGSTEPGAKASIGRRAPVEATGNDGPYRRVDPAGPTG